MERSRAQEKEVTDIERKTGKKKKEKDELTGQGKVLYILTYIIFMLVFTILLTLNL